MPSKPPLVLAKFPVLGLPRPSRRAALGTLGFTLCLLDFGIGLGRKVAGFVALLTLGAIYFRMLVLGQSMPEVFSGSPDPELRDALYTALLLILAQGWDIPTDQLAIYWARLHARLPARPASMRVGAMPQGVVRPWQASRGMIEPLVVRCGRIMDLWVAIANKVGALAVLGHLGVLALQLEWSGLTLRELYPTAADPEVSLLADICVYAVVLSWWAMPFEQIGIFWRRLRDRPEPDGLAIHQAAGEPEL